MRAAPETDEGSKAEGGVAQGHARCAVTKPALRIPAQRVFAPARESTSRIEISSAPDRHICHTHSELRQTDVHRHDPIRDKLTRVIGRCRRASMVGLPVAIVISLTACGRGPQIGVQASTPSTGSSCTPTPATSPTSPLEQAPTLGNPSAYPGGSGFGQVRPSTVYNGGEAEATVNCIVWTSWGGPDATGTGDGYYYKTGSANGRPEGAIIVGFDLGTCKGLLEYQAVEWYFPREKQSFDPHRYQDICNGGYVPTS